MIKKIAIGLLSLVLALMLLAGYGVYYATAPGPLAQDTTVIFRRGEHFQAMTDDLARAGIIGNPLAFKAIAALSGAARRFKPGEYRVVAPVSPLEVMRMIAQGKVVVHKITVREGLSVREVMQMLTAEPVLEGAVPGDIKEGSLLPETYYFTYGDTRQSVIARMQKGMSSLLATAWEKRQPGLPFATPEQALTLASIVEKETGVDGERPRVAAVFINRLRRGIKLQSDPTVAYGIEQQKAAALGRTLTSADLQAPTPYNTYVIEGLPPAPIANPGRAAIEATLNPANSDELYFVATGTGGHHFASTLEQHNRNVQAYRAAKAAR